jgi:hypothetical protein
VRVKEEEEEEEEEEMRRSERNELQVRGMCVCHHPSEWSMLARHLSPILRFTAGGTGVVLRQVCCHDIRWLLLNCRLTQM